MEPRPSERAITNLELTLPNRIYEVSYLMKNETKVDFEATDTEGNYTKRITVVRENEKFVKLHISLDNFTLLENQLCFSVRDVKPVDEEELKHNLGNFILVETNVPVSPAGILPQSKKARGRPPKKRPQQPEGSDSSKGGRNEKESNAATPVEKVPKRKPGRPKKVHVTVLELQESGQQNINDTVLHEAHGRLVQEMMEGKESGLQSRHAQVPTRYRENMEDTDQTLEELDADCPAEERNDDTSCSNSDDTQTSVARSDVLQEKRRPHYKREPNLPCEMCGKYFKDEVTLYAHVSKVHHDSADAGLYLRKLKEVTKVACKLCGKVFGNRRNEMVSHMKRVHVERVERSVTGRPCACPECGREFRREQLLKEHRRRKHPSHERILCHLCPASFKLKEYLTEHLKYTHNKTYNWECDLCHKMLSSPKNLRRHRRLHGTAVYHCHVCGKGFHENGNMRRHVLYVHNSQEVSRSQCPHCERDFSTKNNLIQHINSVHLKTSPYYCDICKKYFNRKKNLLDHAVFVHPGVPVLSTKDGLTTQDIPSQAAVNVHDDSDDVMASAGTSSATCFIAAGDGNNDEQHEEPFIEEVLGNAGRQTGMC